MGCAIAFSSMAVETGDFTIGGHRVDGGALRVGEVMTGWHGQDGVYTLDRTSVRVFADGTIDGNATTAEFFPEDDPAGNLNLDGFMSLSSRLFRVGSPLPDS